MDVREHLPVSVADGEAGFLLFDGGPGRRELAKPPASRASAWRGAREALALRSEKRRPHRRSSDHLRKAPRSSRCGTQRGGRERAVLDGQADPAYAKLAISTRLEQQCIGSFARRDSTQLGDVMATESFSVAGDHFG
jgi:hypothetical protein